MRSQQRVLKKTNRELERDRSGLERQERQLVSPLCILTPFTYAILHTIIDTSSHTHTHTQEAEIKKAAKRGDKATASVYAKQLVRLRQQKAKSMGLSSTITATGHQMQSMQSQAKMAHAMGTPLPSCTFSHLLLFLFTSPPSLTH